jgi:hypothetical protein
LSDVSQENEQIVWLEKYLSSHNSHLPPGARECYRTFRGLSYPEKAKIDGYARALERQAGGLIGSFELIAQLGVFLANQPKVNREAK